MGKRRAEAAEPSRVDVEVVRALRAEILRPGQSPEELVFAGDDAPDTLHAAVLEHGAVIAVASVMREPFPTHPSARDWRVRGMATRPPARGRGAGRKLLELCISHARGADGTLLWCNARVPARGFYELAGFVADGDTFEIPRIGPHVLMWLALAEPR
jgi:GNAT superfamily N-acetyltransferase